MPEVNKFRKEIMHFLGMKGGKLKYEDKPSRGSAVVEPELLSLALTRAIQDTRSKCFYYSSGFCRE